MDRILLDFYQQRRTKLAHACYMFLLYQKRNYLRFFSEMKRLTFLESCCLLYHISSVRADYLGLVSYAYCNKHFDVPIETLTSWFSFDEDDHTKLFLTYFQVSFSEDQVFFREKKQYALKAGKEKQDVTKQCTFNKLIGCKMDEYFDVYHQRSIK